MSNHALTPRSALNDVLVPGHYGAESGAPGVTIRERRGLALASVTVRKGKTADLVIRVKERFSAELPLTPRRTSGSQVFLAWAGPGRWLVEAANLAPAAFECDLRNALSDLASVTSQSDGRTIIRVKGPKAREVLSRGVPLDLDPRVFAPGDTALTVVAHMNAHLWQCDTTPTYDFAVFRSYAVSFCNWLLNAAAQFGAEVLDADAPVTGKSASRSMGWPVMQ